ncbi:MAG: trypsin-like peptidase domain-containing protein [Planctomycetes bacterium]|nr:trypsin-like peptidase domain-containing protein [Planctomycetota bacterium]
MNQALAALTRELSVCLGLSLCLAPFAIAEESSGSNHRLEEALELQDKFAEVYEAALPKTVLIKTYDNGTLKATGSGAIIDATGNILTCAHVVEPGNGYEVILSDQRVLPGKLLSSNPGGDYAMLKIDAPRLSPFTLGRSGDGNIQPGDFVIALGHPMKPNNDAQPAMCVGVVRDVNGRVPGASAAYPSVIVTDVPLFSGNSGGPLVNLDGELIGINAAIRTDRLESFSICLDEINNGNTLQLMRRGEIREEWLSGGTTGSEMNSLERFFSDFSDGTRNLFGGLSEGPLGRFFSELFGSTPNEAGPQQNLEQRRERLPFRPRDYTAEERATLKPYLGLTIRAQTQVERSSRNYRPGLIVVEVRSDGPASLSEVKQGDFITGIMELGADGRWTNVGATPLTEPTGVIDYVTARKPGDAVHLEVRSGENDPRRVTIVLGHRQ